MKTPTIISLAIGIACFGAHVLFAAESARETMEEVLRKPEFQTVQQLRVAAEQGDADAQYELGARYLWGNRGASVDKMESARWYRKAAEQGIAKAQRQLADYYKNGEGITKDIVEAVKWYRKAAEQWDDAAMNSLGECYAKGEGVAINPNEAVKWFRKAAEPRKLQPGDVVTDAEFTTDTHNYSLAQNNLGLCYAKGEGVAKDPVEAVKWFRKAAEQGNSDAQNNLGVCYANGEGVAKDTAEAARLFRKADNDPIARFNLDCCIKGENVAKDAAEAMQRTRKAAEQGDAAAQFNLGFFYMGVDVAEVIRWWRKAAEQGYAEAQRYLGHCCQTGQGVPKDYEEALKWYRKAADQGNAKAQRDLGDLYKDGEGVIKDVAETVKWYRKAAEQGDDWAQRNLGECYEKGEGVAKDEAEAARWYRKAAEQGDFSAKFNLDRLQNPFPGDSIESLRKCAERDGKFAVYAQWLLGYRYIKGNGVEKDEVEGVRWSRRAAEQGYAPAQGLLGWCYGDGKGVVKDLVQAYKWIYLAATQGDKGSFKWCSEAERFMTPAQIAEAQRLSREFRPRRAPEGGAAASGDVVKESRPAGSATGFFITDDGYFVTNQHVVAEGNQFRLLTSKGLLVARIVKVDVVNDLAVLKAEGRFAALPVAPSRGMKLGESVATIGFPNIGLQGFAPKLAKGEIASLTGVQDDARQFQISVPVQPGNSGGALVDSHGNVVGVVVGKLSQKAALAASGQLAENVNYAVKSSFLLSFLESLPEVSSKLKEPNTTERKFEDVVKSVEQAAVLVLVY